MRRDETAITTLVSPIPTTPTRWWMATAISEWRSFSSAAIRSISASAIPSYASYSSRTTSRPREWARVVPVNVAIAPASSEATSRTASSSESGSSESRKAPPETGGISATSSPSASTAVARRIALVDRDEKPGGSSPRPSAGQTSPAVEPSGSSISMRARSRELAQAGKQADSDLHRSQRSPGVADRGRCHVTSAMATMLPRTNLNEQVYETLRQRVLRRDPGPGAKLSLHELATELGVSRSPVHHALTRLVSEGLLSVKARRGYYVTPVTPSTVGDGYDVRLALELHAAERTVGVVDPARLGALPHADGGVRGGDLAGGVGRGERGLPRVPDRPRRQRDALRTSTASCR